jgi:hypothetical protein
MPSPEDKIAAKALVKLGLVPENEIGDFLEAVDEVEPEGGLLGLLVEDGRISEADRQRIEKAIANAKAQGKIGTAGPAPGKPAGKPAAAAPAAKAPAKAPAKKAAKEPEPEPEPEPEAEPEAEAAKPAKARGKDRVREKPSSRRRKGEEAAEGEGERQPKAAGGGKGKILVLAGAGIGLVAAVAVVLVLVLGPGKGGWEGGSSAGDGDKGTGGKKASPGDSSGGSASSPSGGGRTPSAPAAPAIPPMELLYRFREGLHIVYLVSAETKDSSPNNEFTATSEVNEFIDCLGAAGKNQRVCVERQRVETMQRGKNPPERQSRNQYNFTALKPEGDPATERAGGADDLLWVLGDLVFPPEGRVAGGAWKLEREAKQGRFDVKYRVEKTADPAPGAETLCARIAVKASFPGGAPPASYRMDRAEGTIWFDAAQGVVVHAKAFLDTSPTNSTADKPVVTAVMTRTLRARTDLDADSRRSMQTASDIWFGILDMVEQRQYAKALKVVETADRDLDAKYCPIIPDLRAVIPEVRMTLLAGAAMRDRKGGEYQSIPWRRPDRDPAMLMGDPPRVEGKRRPLPLVDKPAPEWLAASLDKGKASVLYYAMAHIPGCVLGARKVGELSKKYRGSVNFKAVLLESEGRKAWEFAGECWGGPAPHMVQVEPKMLALTEGKIPGVPAFFVVDAAGIVRYAEMGFFGETTVKELEAAIARVK